ncbi:MAG: RNA polymerase sigma factor, partial [Planctomycetota bacterium]
MDEERRYIELVSQAQHGDRESLDVLAGLVRGRVYAYVYRIVLEEQSAQDIVQESMFEMFKILGKLEHKDRFWPWLRGIAFNKIRRHRLEKQRHKKQPLAGSRMAALEGADTETGLANLVAEELRQIVLSAMKELKPRHRKVLTMRCYEEMQYRQIAELMGCSELGVRMLFYRAKKSLERALSRKGLGKGFFVTALVLFGKMTAPSESAAAKVSLQAATLKVGTGATVLAIAGGKTAVVSVAAAGALAVGTMVATSGPGWQTGEELGGSASITREIGLSGAKQEQWYYFSEGAGGPVMMRMMSTDAPDKPLYCAWRQNDRANYFYDRGQNTAFIESSRLWHRDLRVWRLPTDKPKLREFLSQVEGRSEDMEYVRGEGEGLLVISRRGGAEGDNGWRQIYHRNILDEEYFRYNWPSKVKVVDNRDAMHERGWTYFVIKGRVDGE